MIQLELSTLKRDWIEESYPVVIRALADKRVFTSDDLYSFGLSKPECLAWYGVLIAKLKNRGVIRRIGYQPSARPQANGRVVAIWERV